MSAKTTCVSAASMIFALVFGQAAAETVRPDWSSFAPGSVVTIASGVTNLAEEADMKYVNALSSISFADATAAIRFTGETAPAVTFSGKGAIIKDSTHDWTLAKAAGNSFKGSYILKGGIVTPAVPLAFGCGDTDTTLNVHVESGATLKFTAAAKNNFLHAAKLHLSGAGKDGKGALWVAVKQATGQNDIWNIELHDDAVIFAEGQYYYFYHSWGKLAMNGHALTIAGKGDYYMYSVSVSGGGEIRMQSCDAKRTFCVQGNTRFALVDGVCTTLALEDKCELEYRESEGKKDTVPSQNCALKVSGNVSIYHDHQFYDTYGRFPFGEYGDYKLEISGPVEISANSNLQLLLHKAPHCQLKLSGEISGGGNIFVKGDSQVYISNLTNTFSGSLTCSGAVSDSTAQTCAILRLGGDKSAPNYAAVTCSYGRVVLDVKSDASAWSTNAIVDFMNTATFKNNALVSMDASSSADSTFVFPGSSRALVENAQLPVSSDGRGTLTVTGPLDDRAYAFGSIDGTLKFMGEDPIVISNLFSAGSTAGHSQEVGNVVFDGAANINMERSLITLGNQYWATSYKFTPGYMAVSNTLIVGTSDDSYPTVLGNGGIFAGWYGQGALSIGEGAVITSNFMVAYGSDSSRGAVYQRDGDVTMVASTKAEQRGYAGVVGYQGYGYYEVSGGKLNMLGRPSLNGIMSISGGEVLVNRHYSYSYGNGDPWLILANKKAGHLRVSGGRLSSATSLFYAIVGYYDGWKAYMTVEDDGIVDFVYNIIGYASNGKYYVNFNDGGTLYCSSAQFQADGSNNAVYYNFNGGTLVAKDTNPIPVPNPEKSNATFVTLYAGGMRFDSNDQREIIYSRVCPVPITDAEGMGVSAVPLPEGLAEKELVGPPTIEISGDGSGAIAYVDFDSISRRVTGVRVICPGQGYVSAPTATFKMGAETLGGSICTLAANTSGGLEKLGRGYLRLDCANEYKGPTVVSGGRLIAGCHWAISTNSAIVLRNGGILDFNSKNGKILSLTYGAGGGTIMRADNAEIPEDYSVSLSIAEVMAGSNVVFDGAVDLDGKTVTVTGDMGKLLDGPARRYTVLAASSLAGELQFECGELPKYWTVRVRNARVELARARNFSLIVR